MDDRDQPDTNVVNLRRKDDPDAERRKELADKIFAAEDEIAATFSQGNLVPPRPTAAKQSEEAPPEPDPFFARYLHESSNGHEPRNGHSGAGEANGEHNDTAEFFEQMNGSSPDELAAAANAPAAAAPLPGSAHLPADLPRPQRDRHRRRPLAHRSEGERRTLRLPRLPRGEHAQRAQADGEPRRPAGIARRIARTLRTAASTERRPHQWRALLGAVSTIVVAAFVFGGIFAGGGHGAKHSGQPTSLAAVTLGSGLTNGVDVLAGLRAELTGARHTSSAHHNTRTRRARHARVKKHAHHARAHKSKTVASPPAVGASTTPQAATSSATQAPSTSAPQPYTAPETSGSSGGTTSSSSTKRPAFGANGVLGPGSSPNG